MLTLKEAREAYYGHTAKASDVARQLAFAGIAIVWVFRLETADGPRIDPDLRWPLILIVVGLTFDLLQYVVASGVWGIYHRMKERQTTDAKEHFLAPPQLNWPANVFFWGKLVAVGFGYVLMSAFLWSLVG